LDPILAKSEHGFCQVMIRSAIPAKSFGSRSGREYNDIPTYLSPTLYVQSHDPQIQKVARMLSEHTSDPWQNAKRMEQWVYDHISKKTRTVGFASAAEVLRTSEGDCTEHSVLLAALCRAANLPARGVIGLVYDDRADRFVEHMWTEIHLDEWYSLDASNPAKFVDATHIPLATSTLDETVLRDVSAATLLISRMRRIRAEKIVRSDPPGFSERDF
jgi:transglutaminase-like putative cysteine protease